MVSYMSLVASWLILILFPAVSIADAKPEAIAGSPRDVSKCATYTMCDAEEDNGVCLCNVEENEDTCSGAGDTQEIVLNMAGRTNLTAYATSSTSASFTCDLVTSDVPHDTVGDTPQIIYDDFGGHFLSNTQLIRSVTAPLKYVWFNCTIASNAVTINVEVCPR